MAKNIDIFICTAGKFNSPVTNDAYRVVSKEKLTKKDTGFRTTQAKKSNLPLGDEFYSILWHMFHVWKNVKTAEYVGFCHSNLYFGFLDDVPDMDEAFSEVDAIVTNPIDFAKPVSQQYAESHNIKDLELVGEIIKEKFHDYEPAYTYTMDNSKLIPNNVFIMKKTDFNEFCEFTFGVLDEFLKKIGTDIEKHVQDNLENYTNPNKSVDYQKRIGGFLGERLLNVFINKKFKNVRYYNLIAKR
jgi:hypothetical protein